MSADLAPRAGAPPPAVEPPNAVDPRAAKPPTTRAIRTRRLTVTTAPSLGFLGFRAWRGRLGYSSRHTYNKVQIGHRSAPVPVARARVIVREARAPPAEQALAKRLLLVAAAERPALLQDRQHVLDEVGRRAGLNQRRDQEAVEVGPLGERAQLVGHFLRRTDDRVGADAVAMPGLQDVADGLTLEALDLGLAHLRVQLLH